MENRILPEALCVPLLCLTPAMAAHFLPSPSPMPCSKFLYLPRATHCKHPHLSLWPPPCPRKPMLPGPRPQETAPPGPLPGPCPGRWVGAAAHQAMGAGTQHSRCAAAFAGTGHRRRACHSSSSTSSVAPVLGLWRKVACWSRWRTCRPQLEGSVGQDSMGCKDMAWESGTASLRSHRAQGQSSCPLQSCWTMCSKVPGGPGTRSELKNFLS